MCKVTSLQIKQADRFQRIQLLSELYAHLSGDKRVGITPHLFGTGSSGDAHVSLDSKTVESMIADMVRIEELGGNIRFCIERVLVAYQHVPYHRVDNYVN